MALLLGIGIPFFYLMLVGYIRPKFYNHFYHNTTLDRPDSAFSAWICAILLPLTIPVFVGSMLSRYDRAALREKRTENRRAAELDEAKHKARLAEYKAKEHEALDRELSLIERQNNLERV